MNKTFTTCKEKVFQGLFMQHLDGLRNFIFFKSGNTGFSEDTAQEAFMRLWQNCAKVPIESAKSFLYTTANNLFLDNVKHKKVVFKFQQQTTPPTTTQQTPQYLMEEQEFKQKLEKAIAELPESQREVFLMNRIEKLKYREIADRLGISQKAVEKRMSKALLELRTSLNVTL